jgi:hypothetical protein
VNGASNIAKLDVGTDWKATGAKALDIHYLGDEVTWKVPDDMNGVRLWIEVEDSLGTLAFVKNDKIPTYRTMTNQDRHWIIDLNDIEVCGVNIADVAFLRIGIGGYRVGQPAETAGGPKNPAGEGYIYFDDIRLYPPRCITMYRPVGDFTSAIKKQDQLIFDCKVDEWDVDFMADDWLETDGYRATSPVTLQIKRWDAQEPNFTPGRWGNALLFDSGGDDAKYPVIEVNGTDPCLRGAATMSITAWIKQPADQDWVGIVTSRNYSPHPYPGSTELGVYGAAYGGPDGLGYCWNEGDTWQFDAGLDISDNTWTFCAFAVDACGCHLYLYDPNQGLQWGWHDTRLTPTQMFGSEMWIGRTHKNGGWFTGLIDDVRIYNYKISFDDMNNWYMGNWVANEPNPWPVFRWKFDETSGFTAADSGVGGLIYLPVDTIANLSDTEAQGSRVVNHRDFAFMANNWLTEIKWPTW